jgi:invasion protein IalB
MNPSRDMRDFIAAAEWGGELANRDASRKDWPPSQIRRFQLFPMTCDPRTSSHLPATNDEGRDLMMSMRQLLTVLVGSLLAGGLGLAPAFSAPTAGSSEPTLLGQFGSWGAYTASPNGKKVCFALATPTSSKTNPPNRPRDPAYAFVSTRPAEKVTNELSVTMGYRLKPGSEATLEVGGASYAMYTQGDGIWIKNAADEDRLIDAMRKGSDATVKGVSSKGTQTTDVFSLKGLSQALDKVAQDCRH